MTQPNPNNTPLEQQQSDSAIAGLKNQVEDNLDNGKKKSNEDAADSLAENLEQAKDD